MPNVLSRNWQGWVTAFFKTALLCQFVRVVSIQRQGSARLFLVFGGLVVAWVTFGFSLVRRTLALCDERLPYRVVRTGELARETLPPSDAMFSVMLYEWRFFGRGWLFRLAARKYLVRLRLCPNPSPSPKLSLAPPSTPRAGYC